jgi:hypothetical protein
VPECNYVSNGMKTLVQDKSQSTFGISVFIKPGQSFFMSGVREKGIDRSLEHDENKLKAAGDVDKKTNEVLVLILKPSMH